jgi:hypothetical protein
VLLSPTQKLGCQDYPWGVLIWFQCFQGSTTRVTCFGICLETFACSSGEALKYVLLSDAKKDLEQTLSKFFLDCKHSIGERGVSWASDEVLVSKIMDLLSLTQTLEEFGVGFVGYGPFVFRDFALMSCAPRMQGMSTWKSAGSARRLS